MDMSKILKCQHLMSEKKTIEKHPMKKKSSKLKQHFQKLTPSEVCTSRVQELAEREPDVHLSKLIILGVRLTIGGSPSDLNSVVDTGSF